MNESIYFKAAKKIAFGQAYLACKAIGNNEKALRPFRKYFKPRELKDDQLWFGPVSLKNQLARSLALLFMDKII